MNSKYTNILSFLVTALLMFLMMYLIVTFNLDMIQKMKEQIKIIETLQDLKNQIISDIPLP
jgi:amino acid permease